MGQDPFSIHRVVRASFSPEQRVRSNAWVPSREASTDLRPPPSLLALCSVIAASCAQSYSGGHRARSELER